MKLGKTGKNIAYKLLNRDLTTYNNCQWVIGETKTTTGKGNLCGPGWLHGYEHAEIAHFMNPIHANFKNPVLYRVKVGGRQKRDSPLKSGWSQMTLLEEVKLPIPTITQRIRFAIYCALCVYREDEFVQWSKAWLDGSCRTTTATWAATIAVGAATMAAVAAEEAMAAEEAEAAWAVARAAGAAAVAAVEAAMATGEAKITTSGNSDLLLKAARFAMSDLIYPEFLQ